MTKQYSLPLPHDVSMAADNFMVTASNREAVAWIDRWPDWPARCFILHGPAGSGKTHLMHMWLTRTKGMLLTLTGLAAGNAGEFVAQHAVLAFDDTDAVVGDAAREEALLHFYNAVNEAKGALLLTAGQAPAQWNIGLPDLRSRLMAAPAAALAAPDDDLLSALLIKQFRDRQIDIPMEVVDFLLPRIERTPGFLRALVDDLDRMSLAEGRKITITLARRLLAEGT